MERRPRAASSLVTPMTFLLCALVRLSPQAHLSFVHARRGPSFTAPLPLVVTAIATTFVSSASTGGQDRNSSTDYQLGGASNANGGGGGGGCVAKVPMSHARHHSNDTGATSSSSSTVSDYWQCLVEALSPLLSRGTALPETCSNTGVVTSADEVVRGALFNHSSYSVVFFATQTRADSLVRTTMLTSASTANWQWCNCDGRCDVLAMEAGNGLRCHCNMDNARCSQNKGGSRVYFGAYTNAAVRLHAPSTPLLPCFVFLPAVAACTVV
jgi:hypothetical protein